MLHIGRFFFALKVGPLGIYNNFKGHYIEILRQCVSFLKPQVLMPQIFGVLQY